MEVPEKKVKLSPTEGNPLKNAFHCLERWNYLQLFAAIWDPVKYLDLEIHGMKGTVENGSFIYLCTYYFMM